MFFLASILILSSHRLSLIFNQRCVHLFPSRALHCTVVHFETADLPTFWTVSHRKINKIKLACLLLNTQLTRFWSEITLCQKEDEMSLCPVTDDTQFLYFTSELIRRTGFIINLVTPRPSQGTGTHLGCHYCSDFILSRPVENLPALWSGIIKYKVT